MLISKQEHLKIYFFYLKSNDIIYIIIVTWTDPKNYKHTPNYSSKYSFYKYYNKKKKFKI